MEYCALKFCYVVVVNAQALLGLGVRSKPLGSHEPCNARALEPSTVTVMAFLHLLL